MLEITGKITGFVTSISVGDAIAVLMPLVLFVIGMIIYAIFIFKFYKFVGGKNVFKPISKDATKFKKFLHAMEYVFFYPLVAFFWFLIMAVLLSVLSQRIIIENMFMASMAVIATIRIVSYYSEELSKEIAKLIPLALLALMLLDITQISAEAPMVVLRQLPGAAHTLLYYFVFLVVVEFLFRIINYAKRSR